MRRNYATEHTGCIPRGVFICVFVKIPGWAAAAHGVFSNGIGGKIRRRKAVEKDI